MTAAVGIAVALGEMTLAVGASIVVVLVLVAIAWLERKLGDRKRREPAGEEGEARHTGPRPGADDG